MKVVIKPAGIALVVASIFGLGVLALRNFTTSAPPRTNGMPSIATTSEHSNKEFLSNNGFEGDYSVCKKLDTAQDVDVTGAVAGGWSDNSGWGSIALRYEKDNTNPHSGLSAQKIITQKIGSAYAQLVQYLDIPEGTKLEGTIWARSDTSLKQDDAGIVLRDADRPKAIYGQTGMQLTPEWKSYTVRATVNSTRKTMFIVYVQRAGVNVWVDEASLHIVP